jgi:hypothetical protein
MAGPVNRQGNGWERELRIGDAERTAAADELAEHYAQGRLSTEEHHERLDRIWAARTPSDLVPVFSDLPGSAYQRLPTYASADRPGVGKERPRRGQAPFPGPPFGRPQFGRPPYAGRATSRAAQGLRALPLPLKIALGIVLLMLVLANLPLIIIGLVVWMVIAHQGVCRGPGRGYRHR